MSPAAHVHSRAESPVRSRPNALLGGLADGTREFPGERAEARRPSTIDPALRIVGKVRIEHACDPHLDLRLRVAAELSENEAKVVTGCRVIGLLAD